MRERNSVINDVLNLFNRGDFFSLNILKHHILEWRGLKTNEDHCLDIWFYNFYLAIGRVFQDDRLRLAGEVESCFVIAA